MHLSRALEFEAIRERPRSNISSRRGGRLCPAGTLAGRNSYSRIVIRRSQGENVGHLHPSFTVGRYGHLQFCRVPTSFAARPIVQTLLERHRLDSSYGHSSAPSGEAIYTPFLGMIVECSTTREAAQVAAAHRRLAAADLASLLPMEFEAIVASLSSGMSESVRRSMRERAREMRRRDCF